MYNRVPARTVRARQATVPGGRAPGVYAPQAAPAAPVVLESLEDRRLLSSVTLTGGVLKVVGESDRANDLVVQPAASGKIYVYANNVNKTFRISDVKSVQFTGGSKGDGIFLASKLELDAVVNAGAGDDDIRLGEGDDVVNAGDGDDKIWTRPGNDKAYGGNGDDRFLGDDGNDVFEGGPGNDSADGGGGNDAVLSGPGDDTLIGGNGDDKIDAGTGDDSLRGDAGSDTLFGGDGDDTLGGGSGADTFDGGDGRNSFVDLLS